MGKLFRIYLGEDGKEDEKLFQNYRKRTAFYRIQKQNHNLLKHVAVSKVPLKQRKTDSIPKKQESAHEFVLSTIDQYSQHVMQNNKKLTTNTKKEPRNNSNSNDNQKDETEEIDILDFNKVVKDSFNINESAKYMKSYCKTFDKSIKEMHENSDEKSEKKSIESTTYCCRQCGTHLTNKRFINNNLFSGRTGAAYLFDLVYNVNWGPICQRDLKTGSHEVSDVFCLGCNTNLGWYYNAAEDKTQKYKIGKFCLEVSLIQLYDNFIGNNRRKFVSSSLLPKSKKNNINHKIFKERRLQKQKNKGTWLPDYMLMSDESDMEMENGDKDNEATKKKKQQSFNKLPHEKDVDEYGELSSLDSNDPPRKDTGPNTRIRRRYRQHHEEEEEEEEPEDDDEDSLSVSQNTGTSQSQTQSNTQSQTGTFEDNNENKNDDDERHQNALRRVRLQVGVEEDSIQQMDENKEEEKQSEPDDDRGPIPNLRVVNSESEDSYHQDFHTEDVD